MAEGNEVRAVYGWRTWSRWVLLVGMGLVTFVAVPMLVGMAATVEVTWVRVVMPLVALIWLVTALIVVWRLALTIDITPTELRWRGLIRRGVLPIAPITAVSSSAAMMTSTTPNPPSRRQDDRDTGIRVGASMP